MNAHSFKLNHATLWHGRPLELKATAQGRIEGLASPFGGEPDAYGDVIAPGAFSESLARHRAERTPPPMLWSHDTSRPVGRWGEIAETSEGLRVVGQLNLATVAGRDAYEHLQAGDITGLSIGFVVPPGGASLNRENGIRTLTQITLHEVSIVAIPAARTARITGVKSLAGPDELRELLRWHGLPHRFCEKIAAAGWAAVEGKSAAEIEAEVKAAAQTETLAEIAAMLREAARNQR